MTPGSRHVALVTDHAYAPWCAVAVRSLAATRPVAAQADAARLVVHVLHDGSLTASDVAMVHAQVPATVGDVVVHDVDDRALRRLPAVGRFGAVVWLRFLLPDLLADVDRVVYLDADVLVVDPLDDLFTMELDGAPIAAVANVLPAREWSRVRHLGLVDPADYFNSGVLVLDLDALRAEDLVARAADVAAALGDRLRWPDQDVLNVVFAGRWAEIPARYNAQQSFFGWPDLADAAIGADARRAAVADPAIVHFEGPALCKPWNAWSDHPYRDRYRAVMAEVDGAEPVGDGPLADALGRLGATNRFRMAKTAAGLRHQPRVQVRRWAASTRARLLGGPAVDESAVPADADARLRPSRQVPHALATASPAHRAIVARCRPFTMVSDERLLACIDAVDHVVDRGVAGDLVECGVWRGGATLAMVLALQAHGVTDRDIWLYDTFAGMTTPTAADTSPFDGAALDVHAEAADVGGRMFGTTFADASFNLGQVQRLLASTGYDPDRLHYVVGPVEETIPQVAPETVALVRLDTDWYESTRHELVHLYPRLASDGVLIVDDYGHWDGARRAVDEYFATVPRPLFSRSDYSGRIGVKR